MSDLKKIEKMLTAILKTQGGIHWVGGYVYGRTSNDDPFIILYPAADYLNHKVCRVYPHDFKKLPDFIPTADIPGDTEGNPKKGEAINRGIFHGCPPFQVTTWEGKETQMGNEKRFGDVLYISKQPPSQPPAPSTNGRQPVPQADSDHWTKEALTATNNLEFDTAVARLIPYYGTADNVAKTRELLSNNEVTAESCRAFLAGLEAYAMRRKGAEDRGKPVREAHEEAKIEALHAFMMKS